MTVWQALGDLGLAAKACRSSQSLMRKPDPLTVAKVFNTFGLIAKVHYLYLSLLRHQICALHVRFLMP